MKDSARNFLAWTLVTIAAAFAVASAGVLLSTGTFSSAWLVAAMVVYGVIAVAALVIGALAPAGKAPEPAPAAAPVAVPVTDEPRLLERAVIYRTKSGMLVRLTYLWKDGAQEQRYSALTPGESLTLHDINASIDALSPVAPEEDLEAMADAVIAQRAVKDVPLKEMTA